MSNADTIDYQPLAAMKNAAFKAVKDDLRRTRIRVVVVSLIVAAVIAIFLKAGIVILYALPPVAIIYGYSTTRKYKNQVWQNFANANGWSLDIKTSVDELVPPSLQFGHSVHFSPIIQAAVNGQTFDLLTYDCTTGSGRSSQTHYFTVATVRLPTTMPHIFLDTKQNYMYTERDIPHSEKLKLEGDFNDHFQLQIEPGQQIDVLTVLTPDVMQTLLQYNQAEDIEIYQTDLYFILNRDRRDIHDMQQLIESVLQLSHQILENINLAHVPETKPQN